ncbi:MAG: uncharacterized protein QG594_2224 [Bacteroidota bacterium]|jgi:uncharacterized membrane protein YuzA (DUF378 family)|nr:uncharacterized protein [Bacteroidota bacterium]
MLNKIAFILVIIGALNWGLVGAADFNLVSMIFGEGSTIGNIVYILVGLSALVLVFMGGKKGANMAPSQQ